MTFTLNLRSTLSSITLCLLVFVVLQHHVTPGVLAQGSDSDMFKRLWQQLNDILTPKWDSWNPNSVPSQFFVMETPGYAINPNDFDNDYWIQNRWTSTSPSYNSFQITDVAPAYSNFMVDRGIRISNLWSQFLTGARTESPQDDPDRASRYKTALSRLFNDDFTLKPVNQQRQALLDAYSAAIDQSYTNRYNCLQRENQDPLVCAQKAIIWKETLSASWYAFETINRDLLGTQSEIMALQRNDLLTLLAKASRDFGFAKRQEVGLSGFLEDYYLVDFEPSNWWTWWRECNGTCPPNPSFISVAVSLSSQYSERQQTFDRLFSNASSSYSAPLIRISSSNPSSNSTYVNLQSSSSVTIQFEVAKVKVSRPWLDMSLLRYSPLAINGILAGTWASKLLSSSDIFPLLPTSMVVARNIVIRSSQFDSATAQAFADASSPNPSTSVAVGPFSVGSKATPTSTTSASSFSSGALSIPGPQIIGWVCSRVPYFPNANVDDLANSTSPSKVPAVPV